MTDLEKLKNTFNEIGVFYVEEIGEFQVELDGKECQYINIYPSNEDESKENKLGERFSGEVGERFFNNRYFFEFCNGKLASY